MAQIPRGDSGLICPLHKKSMEEVCHTCPLWVQIRGTDPQTGETIAEEWNCSLAWLPTLLVENSMQTRQGAASSDKVATEINKFHSNMVSMNNHTAAALDSKLIEGSDGQE